MPILTRNFYNRSSLEVAPELLGKILVRKVNNQIISGRIVEVEAYVAFTDQASHSFKGKNKRNSSLYLSAGHAYVHKIHMQNCLDIVTDNKDIPSGVLIRAIEPIKGINIMMLNRKTDNIKNLTNGPGKLCQSLNIDRTLDGIDVCSKSSLIYIIEDGFVANKIVKSTRIGISKDTDKEYRFYLKDNPFVSKNRFSGNIITE